MPGAPDLGGFADVDATGDARAYGRYLERVGEVPAVAEWKERSLALLEPRPGAVLVDVGCGTGDDALALAARVVPGGRVIGVDASAAMVEAARARADAAGLAVEFRVGDVRRLDLPDAAVDGCRAERVLQHLDHPGAAIAEMARVLRPGGRLVVAEPDWGTLVVDPGAPDVVRAVAAAACRRMRSGAVGRALPRLLAEAGLQGVDVAARTLVLRDLKTAEGILDLAGAAAAAVASGALAERAARGWADELRGADARGRLLVAMTAFMARGRSGKR